MGVLPATPGLRDSATRDVSGGLRSMCHFRVRIRKYRTMSNPAFKFDHVHIISENPKASAAWYVGMFGATIAADTIARGAPQVFVELGGVTILIRGRRPG